MQMPRRQRRRQHPPHRGAPLQPQAGAGRLAPGLPGEGQGRPRPQAPPEHPQHQGVRVHRGQQQERGHLHQGIQGAAARRRAHGLRPRLLRPDTHPQVRHPLQRLRPLAHRRRVPALVGEIQDVRPPLRQHRTHHPRLLHGQLPRRRRRLHAHRPHRHAALHGRPLRIPERQPRHSLLLHLLPPSRRQGHYSDARLSAFPQSRIRRRRMEKTTPAATR